MVASVVHLSIMLRFFSFTFFPVINCITFISFYFSYSFVTFFSSYFSFSLTEIDFSVILPFQFLLQLTELTLHSREIEDNFVKVTVPVASLNKPWGMTVHLVAQPTVLVNCPPVVLSARLIKLRRKQK